MIGKMPAKRLMLIILAILLSAAILDVLWWFISPGEAVVNQPGEILNLNLSEATPVNCIFDASGHHTPANSDPQLVFSLPQEEEIKSVAVRLQQPLRRKGYVQVYYGIDEITEINSVGFSAKAGTREFYFNLPGDKYAFLRLDINADCWLDSVSCSDQPASFLRIPPFRPLRILTVAIVLGLAVFCFSRPKVRKCVRALDHDWLNPETRKPVVTVLYAVFAMVMLLHHIVVTLWYPAIAKGTDIKYLRILFPLFAFVSIPLGHMWKDKGFWFLTALVLLEYLRLAIPSPVIAADYASILYGFFGCYSVAKALGEKAHKPFLKLFCILWTIANVFLCFLGLRAAWTGKTIYNLGGEAIFVTVYHRLQLFYSYGVSGIFICLALIISIIGLCLFSKRILWFLCLPVCLILFITPCFSGARTLFVIHAVALSSIITILVYDILKTRSVWRHVFLASLFIVITIVLVFTQTYIPDIFNSIRIKGDVFISRAYAEGLPPVRYLKHRNFFQSADLNSLSTGRIELWRKIFIYGFRNVSGIIWGQSINQPMNIINSDVVEFESIMRHCHNLWLQTLLESGIPGLLLLFSLHIWFLINAFRLIKNKNLPLWKRILPIPVFAVLISELFEHTVSPSTCFPQYTLLYLFMGFTIAIGVKSKAPEQSIRRS